MMDRNFLIQLTNSLYRLTLLFPKKEPLRYKMRERADDILANFSKENPKKSIDPACEDLEILDSFFGVALVQNWASPSDVLAIKKEYDNLRETLKEDKPEKAKKKDNPGEGNIDDSRQQPEREVNQRQEKILEFLRENGEAQVWQIKQILSDVSKRTLRRDFEHMLEQGLIKRVGQRNDTFYQIETTQSSE